MDISGEPKYRLFHFTLCRKANFINRVAVEFGFIPINYRIMAVDSYYPVIIQDKKGEDFSVKLFFALYKFKEFDITP
jgi:hypothetical protein